MQNIAILVSICSLKKIIYSSDLIFYFLKKVMAI